VAKRLVDQVHQSTCCLNSINRLNRDSVQKSNTLAPQTDPPSHNASPPPPSSLLHHPDPDIQRAYASILRRGAKSVHPSLYHHFFLLPPALLRATTSSEDHSTNPRTNTGSHAHRADSSDHTIRPPPPSSLVVVYGVFASWEKGPACKRSSISHTLTLSGPCPTP
jgi:hypothetical protein